MSIHSLEATNDDRKLFENISPQTLSKLSIEQLIITQRGNYRQLSNAETFVGGFTSSLYIWLPIRLIIQQHFGEKKRSVCGFYQTAEEWEEEKNRIIKVDCVIVHD